MIYENVNASMYVAIIVYQKSYHEITLVIMWYAFTYMANTCDNMKCN